ncbi:hypothetical protein HNV10_02125 [Winogradskyella litoriviva]|uniref:Uncharacterized protein n=1 Tax=Winogradskyella litoriviva TaxID=1220182 RepID=A0ABX2E127_9FLAO|nr:hypothetical protein [Winogradskyella litoriviva]NRD22020.1 hypothetical protein [Winogradskyella litoriviva]
MKIIYKSPIATMQLIYGIGLIVIGIVGLLNNVIGVIFLASGLYFFKTEGIEINLDKKTYRKTTNIFNFSFGKWEDLPDIEYVSVFKTTTSSRVWVSSASTKVSNEVIKVNLFYDTNQKIEAFVTDDANDVNDAFKVAQQIATALNVDVLDATTRETKWL